MNNETDRKQDHQHPHGDNGEEKTGAIHIDPYSDEILEEALESDQGAIHIFGPRQDGVLRNNPEEPNIIGILLNMKKSKKDKKPAKPTARPVFGSDEAASDNSGGTREFTKDGKKYSYSKLSFDEFDIQESKKGKKTVPRQEDKIFGNTYNTGSTETQKLPDIKVSGDYADARLDDCYDSEQYTVKRELLDKVYEIYNDSQWKGLPKDKKFPKELAPFIFNDLWNGLNNGSGYSAVDMFIAIAEFMDTSYEKVYEAAGLKVKTMVIQELEGKYAMLSKKKRNRLF